MKTYWNTPSEEKTACSSMLYNLYLYCTRLVAHEGSSSDANIFGQSANTLREYISELLILITQAEAVPSDATTDGNQGNNQNNQGKNWEDNQTNQAKDNTRASSSSPQPDNGMYPLKLHVEAENKFCSLCRDEVPYKRVDNTTWVIHPFEDTLTLSPNTQNVLAVADGNPLPLNNGNDEQHAYSTQHLNNHHSFNDQQPSTSRSALATFAAQRAERRQATNQTPAQTNQSSDDDADVVGIYENSQYAPYHQYEQQQQHNPAARSPRRFYGVVRKTPLQLAILREAYDQDPYPDREDVDTLATSTGLEARIISQWFGQQRRRFPPEMQKVYIRRQIASYMRNAGGPTTTVQPMQSINPPDDNVTLDQILNEAISQNLHPHQNNE